MIKATLKDGSVREFESGISAIDAANQISGGLGRAACGAKINGEVCDLRTILVEDCTLEFLTFEDEEGRKIYRHTATHVLAQAVMRLYPETRLGVGPAIDGGFFYDFDLGGKSFTADQLTAIEAEMKKIIKENLPIERMVASAGEARVMMTERAQDYKLELIDEHDAKGDTITLYKQGEFVDLCAGPHLMSTGRLKAIKLTQCTGAYWRGDANNAQLQRVYGTAFPKQSELDAHLLAIEEAKKRDHNKLGRELELFTTVDIIGQGLPIILPKGTIVIRTLQRFIEDLEESRGYLQTKTPYFAKRELYKISGHWDHYRDGMFVMGDESTWEDPSAEVFALRPMTCPFQFMAYLNRPRSYRDLPLRYNETSTLFRNEASGEMHGLIRVRQFTISEGHLAVRPDQLVDEFAGCLDLARYVMRTLGIEEDCTYRFSKWDENNREKYIGSPDEWERVQDTMREILNDLGINYTEASGEAAFYGPKLDIQFKNVHGKEDTLITIQIDFQLAERFGMVYTDEDGSKKYPYVIHRTSLGCYERTLALLIEKYAGALPMWLSPEQVRILPITDRVHEHANELCQKLKEAGIRATCDCRSEKIGYKIREAQMQKIPYMLVIGDKEAESGMVSVRSRNSGDLGQFTFDDFLRDALAEIATRATTSR